MVQPCAADLSISDHSATIVNATVPAEAIQLLKTISYAYIAPIIIAFGIFGDSMSIMVLSHPVLRASSVVYSYLLALALTDLCTQLSTVPMIMWLVDVKLCTKPAAMFYAHVGFPLTNAFMSASVWIVVFFTLAQYFAVCYPFSNTFRSKRVCLVLTLIAYVLSAAIYIPWAWRKTVRHVGYIPAFSHCPYEACDNVGIKSARWFEPYQWTRETISRFLPFFLIAYFNVKILFAYRKSKARRLSVVGKTSQACLIAQKNEREERRLWIILVAVTCTFVICTLPAAAVTVFVSDSKELNFTFQILRSVANILEFTKFALNFYLYCMINPNIRTLFLCRVTCRKATIKIPKSRGARNGTALAALVLMHTNPGRYMQTIGGSGGGLPLGYKNAGAVSV